MYFITIFTIIMFTLSGCETNSKLESNRNIAYNSGYLENNDIVSDSDDISKILDHKLTQYDKARRYMPKCGFTKFSLNYNKSIGAYNRLEGVQNQMSEQQKRVDNFKHFNYGPRSEEGFYGFTMHFPLKTN